MIEWNELKLFTFEAKFGQLLLFGKEETNNVEEFSLFPPLTRREEDGVGLGSC